MPCAAQNAARPFSGRRSSTEYWSWFVVTDTPLATISESLAVSKFVVPMSSTLPADFKSWSQCIAST